MLAIVTAVATSNSATAHNEVGNDELTFEDDRRFWDRVLKDAHQGSLAPPFPSTSSPAGPPIPSVAPAIVKPTKKPSARTRQPTRVTMGPAAASAGPTHATRSPTREKPMMTPTRVPTVRRTKAPVTSAPAVATLEPTISRPSAIASLSPSYVPSSIPSSAPSSIPSSVSSSYPTQIPSIATDVPSHSPSEGPSEGPTFIDPADRCEISVKVTCETSDGTVNDCNDIPVPTTLCDDNPFALKFKFNGGDCEQSSNLQPSSVFSCQDFNGGPPRLAGEQSYIVVTGTDEMSIAYFSGFVTVGDAFLVDDSGNNLADGMNITIYSSDDTRPETILQTTIFDSSCDINLFLKDRFGSVELIMFINVQQGAVSCDSNVTFVYTVENMSEGSGDTTLQTLESETNIGPLNLTDEVRNVIIAPGNSVSFERSVILDLSISTQYTVKTVVTGLSPQGYVCRDDDFLTFEAGQRIPQSAPTSSPTSSPSTSPVPTRNPDIYSCELLPIIECSVLQGPLVSCEGLRAPSQLTCLGDRSPYELVFLYTAGPCPGTNNANGFRCNDRNGGLDNRDEAWLLVQSQGETLFNATVNKEDFIVVRGAFNQFTDLTLFSISNGGPGIALRAMRMKTMCQEQDDLTLLNEFGALQLIGFANGPSGSQIILATVQIEYQVRIQDDSATSTGIPAVVQRAESNGAFDGFRVLRSTPSNPVGSRDTLALGSESKTINLVDSVSTALDFELAVNATSAPNPALSCDGIALSSITVR